MSNKKKKTEKLKLTEEQTEKLAEEQTEKLMRGLPFPHTS